MHGADRGFRASRDVIRPSQSTDSPPESGGVAPPTPSIPPPPGIKGPTGDVAWQATVATNPARGEASQSCHSPTRGSGAAGENLEGHLARSESRFMTVRQSGDSHPQTLSESPLSASIPAETPSASPPRRSSQTRPARSPKRTIPRSAPASPIDRICSRSTPSSRRRQTAIIARSDECDRLNRTGG